MMLPAGLAVTQEQSDKLRELLEARNVPRKRFLKWAKVNCIEAIPAAYYQSCVVAINSFKRVAR
jgi:hypothetical protein